MIRPIYGLLVVLVGASSLHSQAPLKPYPATVTEVKDGDTLVVRHAHRDVTIRLDGIDAPEMMQRFGADAKKALSLLRDMSTGVRHNSRCRFYMNSKGSFGTGGRACKICGG